MQRELNQIKQEDIKIRQQNEELKKEISTEEKRIEHLEREVRKKNIVIFRMEEIDEKELQELKDNIKPIMNEIGV